MDLEAAKTSLLCEWIVEAMKPNELISNSCLDIGYQGSNLKEEVGGLAWIGLTSYNTKDSL